MIDIVLGKLTIQMEGIDHPTQKVGWIAETKIKDS
jgi:hypothetical protein